MARPACQLPSFRVPSTGTESSPNWLGSVITHAKVLATASELNPFPFVKAVFCTAVVLLEAIERVKKNRDDLRDLAECIVDIITIIHDELITRQDCASRFSEMCIDFNERLCSILKDLNEKQRDNRSWVKQYIKSSGIRDDLEKFKKRVENLRANFALAAVVETKFGVTALHQDVHSLRSEVRTIIASAISRGDDRTTLAQEYRSFKIGDLELIRQVRKVDTSATQLSPVLRNQNNMMQISNTVTDFAARISTEGGTVKTVRIYEGLKAHSTWQKDLLRFKNIRHPNVLQLFGVSESSIPFLVFHGELRTLEEFITFSPPKSLVQFEHGMLSDFESAAICVGKYWDASQASGRVIPSLCQIFITSDGRMCIAGVCQPPHAEWAWLKGLCLPNSLPFTSDVFWGPASPILTYAPGDLDFAKHGTKTLLLTFHDFLSSSRRALIVRQDPSSLGSPLAMGIIYRYCEHKNTSTTTLMPLARLSHSSTVPLLRRGDSNYRYRAVHLSADLIRYTAQPADECRPWSGWMTYSLIVEEVSILCGWLSQANHTITTRRLLGCEENLLLVYGIEFEISWPCLTTQPSTDVDAWTLEDTFMSDFRHGQVGSDLPPPSLFVRHPYTDEQGFVCFPQAYWSQDPLGREPLASPECFGLGEPRVCAYIHGYYWKPYHYHVLLEFHRNLGFDPESDEVARYLGVPLAIPYDCSTT